MAEIQVVRATPEWTAAQIVRMAEQYRSLYGGESFQCGVPASLDDEYMTALRAKLPEWITVSREDLGESHMSVGPKGGGMEHEWVTAPLSPEDSTEVCLHCKGSRLFVEGQPCLDPNALHGQPEGFTWDDVDELLSFAHYVEHIEEGNPGEGEPLRDLAGRIAALLPPREGET